MFALIITIFYSCLYIYVDSVTILSLNNYLWKIESDSGLNDLQTKVPNGIYSDLRKNDFMGNIFWGFNDQNYSWIATDKWTYYCFFRVNKEILNASNAELVFHGIDGTATIYFNDTEIGKASNTFVRYRFNVKTVLKDFNKISIIFDSPIKVMSNLLNKFENYTSSRQQNENSIKNVNFLRRMQASFGTEWAPALPSVSIWKNVELIVYEDDLIIRDIMVTTNEYTTGLWKVEIVVYCDVSPFLTNSTNGSSYDANVDFPRNIGLIMATLTLNDNKIFVSNKLLLRQHSESQTFISQKLFLNVPQKYFHQWWPINVKQGSQKLYPLTVTFFSMANKEKTISKSIKIGFRKIKLLYYEENDSFDFIFNDNIPIFAKGVTFLPISILPEESFDEKKIDYLLKSAVMANMNMLRVPASGIYQSDYFYEMCDKYGILIWQEFMLDKDMYPFENEEFKQSLITEITQQFRRLQYHPSIAIFVTNNDVESSIKNLENKTKQKKWIKEYSEFLESFANILAFDEFRPYVITNSSNKIFRNNLKNIINITKKSNSFLKEYEFTSEPNNVISKYGVKSLPSFQSLRSQALKNDLSSIHSEFMNHRQRNDTSDAYAEMICTVSKYFGVPIEDRLDAFIYASQISQTWSMKLLIEYHIESRSYRFLTGALNWHLNDVWIMPSISSIEYNGKWKMLHYFARKFFAPITSSIKIADSEDIRIHLNSDMYNSLVDLSIEIFQWSKLQPVYRNKINDVEILSLRISKTEIDSISRENLKLYCNTSEISESCLIKLTIYYKGLEYNTNYFLPETLSLRNITSLPNPEIKVEITSCNPEKCIITLWTDSIALFVWLDVGNIAGYFSDNGFIMTEPQKEITFYLNDETDPELIRQSLNFKVISREFILENFSDPQEDLCNFGN